MNVRTNIFIWIFVATILPLTALALAATYYVEKNHRAEVNSDIRANLENLAAEVRRQHQSELQLVSGLASSPAVREILPVLFERRRGNVHREINIRRSRINRFFQGFQTILSGQFYIRVLDYQGNSLVKVSRNRRSPAIYEGIEGIPLVEPELNDPAFIRYLGNLPANQVAVTSLPQRLRESDELANVPKQDYLMPLHYRKRLVGAIAVTLLNSKIDQVFEHAPRPYRSTLSVIELNPDDVERNGLIIFDDTNNLRLTQSRPAGVAASALDEKMLDTFEKTPQGQLENPTAHQVIFYNVSHPFNSQLISWVISSRIDSRLLNSPFSRLRHIIWGLAGLALLITLTLASIGVRQISVPLKTLSKSMRLFASGKRSTRSRSSSRVDEVRALQDSFNNMADTIQQVQSERDRAQRMMVQSAKLASLGEMAAGIGHELNNPLNNILSYSKLIRRMLPQEAEQTRRDLDNLRDETLRASEIVKGILNFARQVPPRYELFDIIDWIDTTIDLVSQAARNKNIHIRTVHKLESGELLEGDRAQLQQVLVNLLLNAIHCSDIDAQIVVTARIEDEYLLVSVRDEGTGIEDELLDKIFDPFFSTKAEGEGTGLGLSVSLGIVEHHLGTMEIRNNPDQGATATVYLPLRASGNPDDKSA